MWWSSLGRILHKLLWSVSEKTKKDISAGSSVEISPTRTLNPEYPIARSQLSPIFNFWRGKSLGPRSGRKNTYDHPVRLKPMVKRPFLFIIRVVSPIKRSWSEEFVVFGWKIWKLRKYLLMFGIRNYESSPKLVSCQSLSSYHSTKLKHFQNSFFLSQPCFQQIGKSVLCSKWLF